MPPKGSKPKLQKKTVNKQQQDDINKKILTGIDNTYQQYSEKFKQYSTFFAIFTKHNEKICKILLDNIQNVLNFHFNEGEEKDKEENKEKFYRQLQHVDNRDINQFIMHGDVAVGVIACFVKPSKIITIVGIYILPKFQNFGFGSRLMVHLIKSAILREKVEYVIAQIPLGNEKLKHFFERFGFKLNESNSNDMNNVNGNNDNNKNENEKNKNSMTFMLDVKSLRQTMLATIKKETQ